MDFCARYGLSIMKATCEHRVVHTCTWYQATISQRSMVLLMIDFVIASSDLWPPMSWTPEGRQGQSFQPELHLHQNAKCSGCCGAVMLTDQVVPISKRGTGNCVLSVMGLHFLPSLEKFTPVLEGRL